MRNEDKPISDGVDENAVEDIHMMDSDEMEAFDRFIIKALGQSALQQLAGGIDPSAVLSDADRKTLESMGPPAEIVCRICSQIDETRAMSGADAETWLGKSPNVGTSFFPASSPEEEADDFKRLLNSYNARQQNDLVSWTCEYQKGAEIGSGGQGIVYRMECGDSNFSENRALKVFSPKPYKKKVVYGIEMERMKAVAAVVHQIGHENLLRVERFAADGGIYMMIMRQIDGYDLQWMLRRATMESLERSVDAERLAWLKRCVYARCSTTQCGLTPGVAVYIIENCLRGAGALHANDIVHCDIKPSNIMLDCDGSIRLIDIGSACHTKAPPLHHAWTPRYAPPEVLDGGPWTPKSDLASIGYVLIELLSQRPDWKNPPAGSDFVHTLDDAARKELAKAKRELPDQLYKLIPPAALESPELMVLLRKLIHPDPRRRFDSVVEAIEHTDSFKDSLIMAGMGMTWENVIKFWVRDVKTASRADVERVG